MTKKIIYIYETKYTLRDYERFGAKYFQEQGYEVELWTVTDEKKTKVIEFNFSSGIYNENNYFLLNYKEFNLRVKKNKDAIYMLYSSLKNVEVFKVLEKYKSIYLVFQGLGLIYEPIVKSSAEGNKESSLKYHYRYIEENGIKQYVNYVKSVFEYIINDRYLKRILKKNPPFKVICSTKLAKKSLTEFFDEEKILCVHAQDYDRYLELEEKKEAKDEKYIVFVDGGFAHTHIDFVIGNNDNMIEEEKSIYRFQLERLFNKLEEHYQMPVLVAAHPHGNYPKDAYKGRKLVYNKTPELIKGAEMVVMHISTAINFVLLYDKPVLFLDSDLFLNSPIYFKANYKFFNIIPFKLEDKEIDFNLISNIDREIGRRTFKRYRRCRTCISPFGVGVEKNI